jgi:hypothetical protein
MNATLRMTNRDQHQPGIAQPAPGQTAYVMQLLPQRRRYMDILEVQQLQVDRENNVRFQMTPAGLQLAADYLLASGSCLQPTRN